MHGGSAPQVLLAARRRIALLVDSSLATISYLIRQRKDLRVAFGASRDVLDRAGLKAPDKPNELNGPVQKTIIVELARLPDDGPPKALPPAVEGETVPVSLVEPSDRDAVDVETADAAPERATANPALARCVCGHARVAHAVRTGECQWGAGACNCQEYREARGDREPV
jgi:hypothetical protein